MPNRVACVSKNWRENPGGALGPIVVLLWSLVLTIPYMWEKNICLPFKQMSVDLF